MGRRRRKGKVTSYNRCIARGMKKVHKMKVVAPKCSKSRQAY